MFCSVDLIIGYLIRALYHSYCSVCSDDTGRTLLCEGVSSVLWKNIICTTECVGAFQSDVITMGALSLVWRLSSMPSSGMW